MADEASPSQKISYRLEVALLFGIVAAMVTTGWRIGDSLSQIYALGLVIALRMRARLALREQPQRLHRYRRVRARRERPVCDECGKRFAVAPRTNIQADCPKCAGKVTVPPRTPIQRAVLAADIVIWLVAFVALIMTCMMFGFATILAITAPMLAFVALVKLCARSARPRSLDRTCELCGHVDTTVPPAPRLCPFCRTRTLTPDQAGKANARVIRIMTGLTSVVGLFLLYLISGNVRSILANRDWYGASRTLLLAFVVLSGVWAVVRFLRRARKMSALLNEDVLLDKAREFAGEAGTVVRDGATTIWYSGPANPVPMLTAEIASAHERFQTFFGEAIVNKPSFRLVAFHDMTVFVTFLAKTFPRVNLTGNRGLLLRRPWNTLTLCTSEVPGRLDPPCRTAGKLFDMMHLESAYGVKLGAWIQFALPRALTASDRPADLGRLNRRMVMSLSTGTAWLEELFTAPVRSINSLAMRGKDFHSIQKFEQFTEQSWSVVEYLGGLDVSEERRAGFLAFLEDTQSRSQPEESLLRHLGYGYRTLLDAWREWVLLQGIGPDQTPPTDIRDRIGNRVLPMIRDRLAGREDRILAIRDWRKAGYVLGADTLIDLLRDPDGIPKEEIVWSLRVVSGMTYSDDADRWQDWWDGLSPADEETSVHALYVPFDRGTIVA